MFGLLRNLLALVGVAALVAGGVGYMKAKDFQAALDPGAMEMFKALGAKYVDDARSRRGRRQDGRGEGRPEARRRRRFLKSLAVQHGMLFVGRVAVLTSRSRPSPAALSFISFYSFCDANVGAMMIEYNSAYSAFIPAASAVAEDKNGRLWLHMMSLDNVHPRRQAAAA